MKELEDLLELFVTFEEYYLEKNFETHVIKFRNMDKEIIELIKILGFYAIDHGLVQNKNFAVEFETPVSPSEEQELSEAVNAIHRLKNTIMHRGEGCARVIINEGTSSFCFQNAYHDDYSDFRIDNLEIPSYYLNRIIKTYYENRYHIIPISNGKKLRKLLMTTTISSLKEINERISEDFSSLLFDLACDQDRTFIQFHPIVINMQDYLKNSSFNVFSLFAAENEMYKEILKISDYVFQDYHFQSDEGFFAFDILALSNYGRYSLIDIYELKAAKTEWKTPSTEEECRLETVANHIGIPSDFEHRNEISRLYMDFGSIQINGEYPKEYLNLLAFQTYKNHIEYLKNLNGLFNMNKLYLEKLEDGKNKVLNATHPMQKKAEEIRLNNQYSFYYQEILKKIGVLNASIMGSVRNSVSHLFIETKEDNLLFYDGESKKSEPTFTMLGKLSDYENLKDVISGKDEYGSKEFSVELFFDVLKNYFKEYYLLVENKEPVEASILALQKEKETIARLNGISSFLFQNTMPEQSNLRDYQRTLVLKHM